MTHPTELLLVYLARTHAYYQIGHWQYRKCVCLGVLANLGFFAGTDRSTRRTVVELGSGTAVLVRRCPLVERFQRVHITDSHDPQAAENQPLLQSKIAMCW
jgi:hypothetical protein